MKNEMKTNSREKNISNKKESKTSKKTKKIIINKKNKNFTQSQKRIYKKDISKKESQTKPFTLTENDKDYNLKIDMKVLNSTFNFDFDNSLEFPNLKNETVLNFQKFSNFSFNLMDKVHKKLEIFSPSFQYGARYVISDIHSSLYNNINSVIKIQSCFRSYLIKKQLIINKLDKSYFEKNAIKAIIKIQKNIRGLLQRIYIRKKILIKIIYQKRENAINLIIKRLRIYLNIIKIKRIFFINYHLKQRKQKAIYIQEKYRNYKYYNAFKKLKNDIDKKYFLYYPYKAKKVSIIIYFDDKNKKNKTYSFIYNNLLKYYILLINPCEFFSGKYKCQFVVNDIIISDNRYPTTQINNCFYNIIDLIPRNNKKCKINNKPNIKKIKKPKLDKNIEKCNCDSKKKKKYESNTFLINFKLSLEDIKEEEDEGKSVTSKDSRYEKRIKEFSEKNLKLLYKIQENEKEEKFEENSFEEGDSFNFTEEEDYLEIKNKNQKK